MSVGWTNTSPPTLEAEFEVGEAESEVVTENLSDHLDVVGMDMWIFRVPLNRIRRHDP
jgi:hypothetical protein